MRVRVGVGVERATTLQITTPDPFTPKTHLMGINLCLKNIFREEDNVLVSHIIIFLPHIFSSIVKLESIYLSINLLNSYNINIEFI